MQRTPILLQPDTVPECFREFIRPGCTYDSSCSAGAKVWFLDTAGGFYLKRAAKGTLGPEAELTRFFHSKGLSAQVMGYESGEYDWLLTRRLPGEDCLHPACLADPVRLCDTTAQLLRMLHDTPASGCPIPDRTAQCLTRALLNYEGKTYDSSLFPDNWGYDTPESAWQELQRNGKFLKADTLLHGDYCLPNILLENWQFSGFIDLDAGGIGDRHADLFWGIWSLEFNLKTNRYRERFLDVYGRQDVNEDALRTIAAIEVFA